MSLSKLMQQVAEKGVDQSQATSGGGDYTPPEAGQTGARIVGYYEIGQHESEFEGKKKTQNEVLIVFELIGKKHPVKEINGEKVPVRMTLRMNLSTNEKAGYFKMFSALRTEEKHFVQLLGKPVLLNVVHEPGKKDPKKIFAKIDKTTIRKPIIQVPVMDEEGTPTGDLKDQVFPVGAAVTELGAFVWDFADTEMWDSLYIPGEYPERKDDSGKVIAEARSKNTIQLQIASALNFKGLPCYDYAASKLVGGTVTKEGIDALDGVVGDVANPAADQGTSGEEDDKPPFDVADPMAGVA